MLVHTYVNTDFPGLKISAGPTVCIAQKHYRRKPSSGKVSSYSVCPIILKMLTVNTDHSDRKIRNWNEIHQSELGLHTNDLNNKKMIWEMEHWPHVCFPHDSHKLPLAHYEWNLLAYWEVSSSPMGMLKYAFWLPFAILAVHGTPLTFAWQLLVLGKVQGKNTKWSNQPSKETDLQQWLEQTTELRFFLL